MPRNCVSRPVFRQLRALPSLPLVDATPGYVTPIPKQPLSFSPAWDPSFWTPMPEPERDSDIKHNLQGSLVDPSAGPVSQNQDGTQHILLDPRLLNTRLQVIILKREVTATIESVDGWLSIQRTASTRKRFLLGFTGIDVLQAIPVVRWECSQ